MQKVFLKNNDYWAKKLNIEGLKENQSITILKKRYVLKKGILRSKESFSKNQSKTKETFGYKWKQRRSYESEKMRDFVKKWLIEKYLAGNLKLLDKWLPERAAILDAGCGSGFSSLLLFGEKINNVEYLGVDISEAVDTAVVRFREKQIKGEFLQADLSDLPFSKPTFDLIFSEGVLHHTDNPEGSFKSLSKLIKRGGRFLFYVYRKKSPIREFADDYIRDYLRNFNDDDAWKKLMPITKLGKALGDLKATVNIPEAIPYLGIPSGKTDVQRLFYWHIFKVFYRENFSIQEMNHINFDWYRPLNCFRFSTTEVRNWCRKNKFSIERLHEEEAGISVVAQKRS